MASSFQRRSVRTTFQLAAATFSGEGNPDTVSFEDYRARVEISAPGGYEFSTCRLSLYGAGKEAMDRLTVINYTNLDFLRNTLMIEATDNDGQFTSIFLGEVFQAHPDYASAPSVPFLADARAGLIGSLAPAAAGSYPGAQKVSAIMSRLARELGVTLEDNGVVSTVTDMYLAGSPLTKVQTLANAARIQYWYLPEQGTLAIAPMGVARRSIPVVYNAGNGLVGWPSKRHVGIAFRALFNPQVFHGCKIIMESSVPACNGEWYVVSMNHLLDGNMPCGAWFTDFIATPQNVTIRSR